MTTSPHFYSFFLLSCSLFFIFVVTLHVKDPRALLPKKGDKTVAAEAFESLTTDEQNDLEDGIGKAVEKSIKLEVKGQCLSVLTPYAVLASLTQLTIAIRSLCRQHMGERLGMR